MTEDEKRMLGDGWLNKVMKWVTIALLVSLVAITIWAFVSI